MIKIFFINCYVTLETFDHSQAKVLKSGHGQRKEDEERAFGATSIFIFLMPPIRLCLNDYAVTFILNVGDRKGP